MIVFAIGLPYPRLKDLDQRTGPYPVHKDHGPYDVAVMAQDLITPYLNTRESVYAVGFTLFLAATTPRGN